MWAFNEPVFFHCVAGHHRTGLVHAAYRIRHEGWPAERAWRELMSLPWARPATDVDDCRLIEAFGRKNVAVELWDHGDPLDSARNDALAEIAMRADVDAIARALRS